jgi:hypothetical protein
MFFSMKQVLPQMILHFLSSLALFSFECLYSAGSQVVSPELLIRREDENYVHLDPLAGSQQVVELRVSLDDGGTILSLHSPCNPHSKDTVEVVRGLDKS